MNSLTRAFFRWRRTPRLLIACVLFIVLVKLLTTLKWHGERTRIFEKDISVVAGVRVKNAKNVHTRNPAKNVPNAGLRLHSPGNHSLEDLTGQNLVDYIAAKLVVKYVIDKYGKIYITMTNSGLYNITPDNWTIYFNQASGFAFVAHKKIYHIKNSGVILKHHDGWLFSMSPVMTGGNESFQTIRPNQTLVVWLDTQLKSKSYAFPRWYVSGEGLEPMVISSTQPNRFEIESSFKTQKPAGRYAKNNISDLKGSPKMIIPTPLSIRNGNGVVKLSRFWKVAYTKELKMEALFIANSLHIPYVESNRKDSQMILISLTNISSRFSFAESLKLFIDEGYVISVSKNMITLEAQTNRGTFYGIQSLLSMLESSSDGLTVPVVEIVDAPRFEYRGLMLDVARNFIDKDEVIQTLDVMAMYKLNRLHLHLTDDQGWRIEIPTLPELTEIGSKRLHDLKQNKSLLPYLGSGPGSDTDLPQYFSVDDYKEILQQASLLHIEVIPEIDMPGHSHAAVQSMRMRYARLKETDSNDEAASKFLLHDAGDTSEYLAINEHKDTVLNPCLVSTYTFIKEVLRSIHSAHKDIQPLKTFHLGGDEVPDGALVKSPICQEFLRKNPEVKGNLKLYFMKRIISIANEFNIQIIQSWEDGLHKKGENPVGIRDWNSKSDIIINAWQLTPAAYKFADAGYKVVLSHANRLYLDHPYEPDAGEMGLFWAADYIDSRLVFTYMVARYFGNATFTKEETCRIYGMKECVPLAHPKNIIGIQASLWSEMLRTTDEVQYMLYPRLLPFAERAWHTADWELEPDKKEMLKKREADWTDFANALGYKELKRLEKHEINYRIPTVGVRIENGFVQLNTEFPGTLIQYSADRGKTWYNYTTGQQLQENKNLQFSAVSHDLKRRGRVTRPA